MLSQIQAQLGIDRLKQLAERTNRLRAAQQQQTVWAQAVVKQGQQPALQRGVEVDQEIATAEDVEPGEGRVKHDIMLREKHHVADRFVHDQRASLHIEIARHVLRLHGGHHLGRVAARTRRGDGVRAQIGGKYLQAAIAVFGMAPNHFRKHDGQGVSLFACRATGNPGAEFGLFASTRQQRWQG